MLVCTPTGQFSCLHTKSPRAARLALAGGDRCTDLAAFLQNQRRWYAQDGTKPKKRRETRPRNQLPEGKHTLDTPSDVLAATSKLGEACMPGVSG